MPHVRKQVVIRSRRDEIERAERELLSAIERNGYNKASVFAIRLAFAEAVSNAMIHGNGADAGKTITLRYDIDADRVEINIIDQGDGFDPNSVPDPTEPENVEIPSGRGLVLMRAYMSEVRHIEPGNHVRMVYRRPDRQPTQ